MSGNGKSRELMEGVERRGGLYGLEYREEDQRRVDEEVRKTYDIKGMWQRSHEIINLAARGFKQTEIARIVGCTPQTVSNTVNSELGRRKISDLREFRDDEAKVVAENIRVLTNKALATYHEIFDNESGDADIKTRKDVADTVLLELSGLRAPTKHISATLSSEDIEEFKRRGREILDQSKVIDITEVEDVS